MRFMARILPPFGPQKGSQMTEVPCSKSVPVMPNEDLFHHVFAFGSPTDRMYGQMVLRPGGKILGYSHSNERSWELDEAGDLLFRSENGTVSSRLRAESPSIWLGHAEGSTCPFMLVSLLRHDAGGDGPSIIVNSIPKSGTYFLTAALSAAGFPESGLHLSGTDTVDDNRALDASQMHEDPLAVRFLVQADLAASITSGRCNPAHLFDPAIIDRVRSRGGHVFHVKRDLRDIVTSLYRFKMNRVKPTTPLDSAWRQLPEAQRFVAFLYHYAAADLAHVREMAFFIAGRPAFSYEGMVRAEIPGDVLDELEQVRPGFAAEIAQGLRVSRGSSTSTQSGARSDWHAVWSDDVQRIFEALGLQDANRALGY